jgi:transposase
MGHNKTKDKDCYTILVPVDVFQGLPSNSVPFCLTSWEIKIISQDLRKRIVDLRKSGSSLGAISKCMKVPRSSVQTIVHKYNHHGTTQSSFLSERWTYLGAKRNGPKFTQLIVGNLWKATQNIWPKLNKLKAMLPNNNWMYVNFWSTGNVMKEIKAEITLCYYWHFTFLKCSGDLNWP